MVIHPENIAGIIVFSGNPTFAFTFGIGFDVNRPVAAGFGVDTGRVRKKNLAGSTAQLSGAQWIGFGRRVCQSALGRSEWTAVITDAPGVVAGGEMSKTSRGKLQKASPVKR